MDSAVFAIVPEFARASVALRVDSVRPSSAIAAYVARTAERARERAGDRAGDRAVHGGAGEAITGRASEATPRGAGEPRPSWSEAYQRLGFPEDTVPPYEALMQWLLAAGRLPTQGVLLDLVNAFSLANRTPVSAYDLADVRGGLWLRPARGHELHFALDDSASSPDLSELILVDGDDQVMARHWHGSPGRAFVPGATTTVARLHVDVIDARDPRGQAQRLGDELARLVGGMLGAATAVQVLDGELPSTTWPPEWRG